LPQPEGSFDTVCVFPETVDWPQQWLTWRWAAMLYRGQNPDHLDWRERCREKWIQHFRVLPEITAWVDRFAAENFKERTIAVQVRWHGHSAEQLPPYRSLSWDEITDTIRRELGSEQDTATVYVASGDYESLEWFRARFPGFVCHPTARRSPDRNTDFTKTHRLTEQDAIDVLQEILLISRCDALVHVISNLATVALYIRPELKSIYLP